MTSRRNLLLGGMKLVAAATLLKNIQAIAADLPACAGDIKIVEPGKGMAAGVKYVHNASEIKDASLKVARGGVAFDKQNCTTCAIYKAKCKKDGKEYGDCPIFAGMAVAGTGWCTTWTKKA